MPGVVNQSVMLQSSSKRNSAMTVLDQIPSEYQSLNEQFQRAMQISNGNAKPRRVKICLAENGKIIDINELKISQMAIEKLNEDITEV
jgi:hypothetical protein